MDTETLIRELKSVEAKHKHDKVFTGQLNIAEMAHDTRKRLEELKPYEDIGLTPEQIIELKDRDTARTPVQYGDEDEPMLRCRHCDENVTDLIECGFDFCPYCGGRWEE